MSGVSSPVLKRLEPRGGHPAVTYRQAGDRAVLVRLALCDEAATEAAGDDVRLVQILGFRAISRRVNGDVPGALSDAREGLERAERAARPAAIGG